jgi:hypothetical protein
MGSHEHDKLPIDEQVVLMLTASEAIDPRQAYAWWKELREDYPHLSNEVHQRAYYHTFEGEDIPPLELYAKNVDLVAFVAKALKLIKELEKNASDKTSAGKDPTANSERELSGDDGGEDPPPSF